MCVEVDSRRRQEAAVEPQVGVWHPFPEGPALPEDLDQAFRPQGKHFFGRTYSVGMVDCRDVLEEARYLAADRIAGGGDQVDSLIVISVSKQFQPSFEFHL